MCFKNLMTHTILVFEYVIYFAYNNEWLLMFAFYDKLPLVCYTKICSDVKKYLLTTRIVLVFRLIGQRTHHKVNFTFDIISWKFIPRPMILIL